MPFSCAAASASASARGDLEDPLDRQPALGNERVERLALDQLHREEVDAVRFLDRVDGDDARVIEGGERLGLAPEALQPLRARGHRGGQHLERHVAPELRVGGAVHLAHSARADGGGDAVVGEGAADHQAFLSVCEPRHLGRAFLGDRRRGARDAWTVAGGKSECSR